MTKQKELKLNIPKGTKFCECKGVGCKKCGGKGYKVTNGKEKKLKADR